MSGIKHKLKCLLPVTQWKRRTECVHQQTAYLDPKSVPTGPEDSLPWMMWSSTSTCASLWTQNTQTVGHNTLRHLTSFSMKAVIPGWFWCRPSWVWGCLSESSFCWQVAEWRELESVGQRQGHSHREDHQDLVWWAGVQGSLGYSVSQISPDSHLKWETHSNSTGVRRHTGRIRRDNSEKNWSFTIVNESVHSKNHKSLQPLDKLGFTGTDRVFLAHPPLHHLVELITGYRAHPHQEGVSLGQRELPSTCKHDSELSWETYGTILFYEYKHTL